MPDLETTLELEAAADDMAAILACVKQAATHLAGYYEWGSSPSARENRLRDAEACLRRALDEFREG